MEKIQISIRSRPSLAGDDLREVKVWVKPLPVDYSYGTHGPDHGDELGCAQSAVEVLVGDELSGAVSAYTDLLWEYSNMETIDGEAMCVRKHNMPWPGAWIKKIPHDYPNLHTVGFEMDADEVKILD